MDAIKHSSFAKMIKDLLANRSRRIIKEPGLTSSAVLVPVYSKASRIHILLTRRTHRVAHHKGEISFPGGTYDSSDGELLNTSLRETYEEIGIRPEDITVLGFLDDQRTLSNFCITPVVGTFSYPYPFAVNSAEIDELIEIPLAAFLNEMKCWQEMRSFKGEPHRVYFYKHGEDIIWGATARIIKGFLELIVEQGDIPDL